MIDKHGLQAKLETIIADYLKKENVVLVDFSLYNKGKKYILRILADEVTGGITLDKCAYLNNSISKILDEADLIEDAYLLEVSSPGIDKPIITKDDFSRCLNRKVKIFLNEGEERVCEKVGVIVSVRETGVEVDLGEQVQAIPFNCIRKAKQIIE